MTQECLFGAKLPWPNPLRCGRQIAWAFVYRAPAVDPFVYAYACERHGDCLTPWDVPGVASLTREALSLPFPIRRGDTFTVEGVEGEFVAD